MMTVEIELFVQNVTLRRFVWLGTTRDTDDKSLF